MTDQPEVFPRAITPAIALTLAAVLCARQAGAEAEAVLLEAHELGAGWEVVRESPVDPSTDSSLRAWGVRAQHVRHYTRDVQGTVQVCSVELWSFHSVAQAAAAGAGFRYPGWKISRSGSLLVMVRGLLRQRGRRPVRGIFHECEEIGSRVRERAAAALSSPSR